MSRSYRLSSIAEVDVASIVQYIARENLGASLRLVDRFTETFALLASQPELGESCAGRTTSLRRFSVGNYLVFYQSLDDEIVIARVLHGARQWEHLI
jgi:toxin ParE1/3/4